MDIEHSIALVTAVIAVLGFVLGLPATVLVVRRQLIEAKKALADEANSYSRAAKDAVDSQASLQDQIDELRTRLESRDQLITNLQNEIGKRDSRILDLEGEIQCLHQGQADKEKQIHDLEKLTELQAKEIQGLRREIQALNKKTGTLHS